MKAGRSHKPILTAIFLGIAFTSHAQKSNDIGVRDMNNNVLKFAWAGGLNAPQFFDIDLDGDTILDLFVFDREGNRVLTFLNGGTQNTVDYTYAPQFESRFPAMVHWVILADYNGDGKKDIFTYNGGGIKVYKNTTTTGNLTFSLAVYPYLKSNPDDGSQPSNIFVSTQDLPAIADIDFDGDIDVLSFANSSEQLSFYENYAIDSGNIETFRFHDNTYCWGHFREAAFSNKVLLNQSCPKVRKVSKGNKHSGASMLAFDPDGDQDMDLLLGDPTYSNMVFLENGGNKFTCNMVSQDTNFPSYNTPVNLRIFPSAFYLDVNNDGRRDLLVSPNSLAGIENYQGVLYYKNIGSSGLDIFQFQVGNFLQSDMIDLGSNAYPVLFDHNNDGLLDIIVGNNGYFKGPAFPQHSLALFENTGSLTSPEFRLTDTNYVNLAQYNLNTILNQPTFSPVPAFGDVNTDGNTDMIVGDFQGRLHYFQNEPVGGKSNFVLTNTNFKSIDVGTYASPFLTDLNGDGLVDIAAGQQNGLLDYFPNKGSFINPEFDSLPENDSLGLVNTTPWNEYDGFSQARFYKSLGELYLISGSKNGVMYRYGNIAGNLNGKFTLLDSFYLDIDAGSRSHYDIGDINGDGKFDIFAGNSGGGLSLYYTDEIVGIQYDENRAGRDANQLIIHWLPDGNIMVEASPVAKGSLEITSVTGQRISTLDFNGSAVYNTSGLGSGLYIITIYSDRGLLSGKFALSR